MTATRKLTLIFLIAGLALGTWVWLHQNEEKTDDAFIERDVTWLAPRVAGPLIRVAVTENAQVSEGDLIAEIDPAPFRLAVQQAEAARDEAASGVARAEAALAAFRAQQAADERTAEQAIAVARADLNATRAQRAQLQTELAQARRDAKRYAQLARQRQVSQQQLDQAQTRVSALEAQVASLDAAVEVKVQAVAEAEAQRDAVLARRSLETVRLAEVKAAQATLEAARARVESARLDLSHTRILAPADGVVTHIEVHPGSQVGPTRPVAILVSGQPWLKANFKETQLARMKAGQPVRIELDSLTDQVLTGRVASFQPGTGARFSVLPPENASGNFVKVVQRVPVRIELDTPLPEGRELAAGLSATVVVDTGRDAD